MIYCNHAWQISNEDNIILTEREIGWHIGIFHFTINQISSGTRIPRLNERQRKP